MVLRVDPAPPRRWRVAVADEGPNLEPSTRARLFEPFWRQSGDSVGGAGLGLAFVRVVAVRHGGAPVCLPIPPTGNLIGLEVDATRQERPVGGLAFGSHPPPVEQRLTNRRGSDRRAIDRREADRRAGGQGASGQGASGHRASGQGAEQPRAPGPTVPADANRERPIPPGE